MIPDIILKGFANLFIALISLLPNASATPGTFESAWNWLGSAVSGIVYILNGIPTSGFGVGTSLMVPFGLMITFLGSLWLLNQIKMLFNAIRGSGI